MLPRLLARSWPDLLPPVPSDSFRSKAVYNPKAFIPHAALLRQAFAHCARFPTAASRRSLGRVSVPVWLIILSDQLPVDALVGRYPTNKLIGRETLPNRNSFFAPRCRGAEVSGISPPFGELSQSPGYVSHVLLTRSPLASPRKGSPVRLACVKHAASVRPEPGSNSPSRSFPPAEAGKSNHVERCPAGWPDTMKLTSTDGHPTTPEGWRETISARTGVCSSSLLLSKSTTHMRARARDWRRCCACPRRSAGEPALRGGGKRYWNVSGVSTRRSGFLRQSPLPAGAGRARHLITRGVWQPVHLTAKPGRSRGSWLQVTEVLRQREETLVVQNHRGNPPRHVGSG